MAESSSAENTIERLVGVYHADGTIRGELTYWFGARLGRAHCALCVLTHGSVRQRPEWMSCRAELPVAFDTYHRNDQPNAVRVASGGVTPIVLAELTDASFVVLLGPEELEACGGSLDRFADALTAAALESGLAWGRR